MVGVIDLKVHPQFVNRTLCHNGKDDLPWCRGASRSLAHGENTQLQTAKNVESTGPADSGLVLRRHYI